VVAFLPRSLEQGDDFHRPFTNFDWHGAGDIV